MYKDFKSWLKSPGGGGKNDSNADQITCKVLKYVKFCSEDVSSDWNFPLTVSDYCLGSVEMISEFVKCLQEQWGVGYSGVIGYMNSLNHALDFRRTLNMSLNNMAAFVATEVYINRIKKCLSRKMRIEWNEVLSIEYLSSINCWARLEELQNVIPYYADKFTQIILNASESATYIPSHDLSFATSYVIAVLFLMVKATRPMTYQFLTVTMIRNISTDGIIDQTVFKTSEKYGFDSLIFPKDVIDILNGYIACIRSRLNPSCDYLLITRNGTQISQLSGIFGRIVFLAIGKYINPTRYRQIIEIESLHRLS